MSGLVAGVTGGGAGPASVVGAHAAKREAEPRAWGGSSRTEMGVVPGVFHEGAAGEHVPGEKGEMLKAKG